MSDIRSWLFCFEGRSASALVRTFRTSPSPCKRLASKATRHWYRSKIGGQVGSQNRPCGRGSPCLVKMGLSLVMCYCDAPQNLTGWLKNMQNWNIHPCLEPSTNKNKESRQGCSLGTVEHVASEATSNKCIATSIKCITTSSK